MSVRVGHGARRSLAALPLRVRLVAGFVVVITLVLAAAGTFVYWRVSYALDLRLNSDLRGETTALAPLVTADGALRDDPGLDRTPAARRYQVLDAAGRVLASGSELGPAPLLSPRQARAALDGEVVADVGELLPVSRRPLRLLTRRLGGPGPARVLVVADRRDGRDEALRELLAQLLLAGLGALVVTAVVGERLAKAALAPVERYRTQAARIAGGASGVRLDVPAGRDDEVTRLGHTLNDVLDALEHAVDRERRFTQDASHELRTPLTLLSTRVQLSLRRPRTAGEQEATLRELGRDIDALTALADQLLRLSTTDVGRSQGDDGCDLAELARSVTREHAAGGQDRAGRLVSVSADPGTGALPVAMPAAQVRQVLANLLGNALTHGGDEVRVQVRAAGATAVLTVSDAGPGVDPSFLPSATERFARADLARGRAGAGLGLSLVRALVDRYDGELRLCSAGSHHRYAHRFPVSCAHGATGTTATVLLPVAPGAGAGAAGAGRDGAASGRTASRG